MLDSTRWLLLLNLSSSWMLCGLIWAMQCVHYPLLAKVGGTHFAAYHGEHCVRITWLVVPLMLIELGSCLGLCWLLPKQVAVWIGLLFVALVWGSTIGIQSPQHLRLSGQSSPALVAELVSGNWIRTIAWSGKALVTTWLLWAGMSDKIP